MVVSGPFSPSLWSTTLYRGTTKLSMSMEILAIKEGDNVVITVWG
jgi:hypothetical protein